MIGRFCLFILYGSCVRSLSLATLHLLSFEPSRSLFYTSVVRQSRMPTPGDGTESGVPEPNVADTSNPGDSPVINEVFSMFKSYLEVKLDEKSKEIESKSKVDKQVTLMKFKGNQRQFEHNAKIDSIFDRLTSANVPENKNLTNLIVEGKELIRKRQKLIRIADKSADGWRVVDEYVSDELASGSEDEKRGLKRAKDAANRKRRQATQARHGPEKRIKTSLLSTDQQLFRGEPTFSIIYLLIL